jgi:MFS family permease
VAFESTKKLLKSNLGIMMLSSGIWRIGFSMTTPFWALYVIHLGGKYIHVGLISAVSSVLGLIPSLFGGYLADAYGRKKMVAVFSAILALNQSIYFLAPNWEWLFMAQAVNAVFSGLRQPSFSALLADSTNAESRAMGFGMWQALPQIFGLASPYIIGLLMDNYGIVTAQRWAYIISMSMGLVGAFMRWNYLEETLPPQGEIDTGPIGIIKETFMDFKDTFFHVSRQIWVMIIMGILFQFGGQAAFMFMVTYATEDVIHLSASQWGLINTVSQLTLMLISLPASIFIDRHGRLKPVILSLMATPAVILLFIWSQNFIMAFTSFILLTILGTVGGIASQALFVDYSPRDHRGRIYALTSLIGATQSFNIQMMGGFTLIGAVGNIVGGALYQQVSFSSPFFLMALTIGLSGVMGFIWLREPKVREE